MTRILILVSLVIMTFISASAQISNNMQDRTFGFNGVAVGNLGNQYHVINTATAVQPDGKIIVAGTVDSNITQGGLISHVFLMRFTVDGLVDFTFQGGGYVSKGNGYLEDSISSIVLQPDGKIVLVGWTDGGPLNTIVLILRFNADGTPDGTFGVDGRVELSDGNANCAATSVAIQADGQIVLGGYLENLNTGHDEFLVVRLDPDGNLDNTFGSGGVVTTAFPSSIDDHINALVIQADQKIVVAGITRLLNSVGTDTKTAIARFDTGGNLDGTFATGGKFTRFISQIQGYDMVSSAGVQSDGKLIIGNTIEELGAQVNFGILRFNTNGVVDSSFGFNGLSVVDFEQQADYLTSMVITPDDHIIVAGITHFDLWDRMAVAKCNSDGNPDIMWSSQGRAQGRLGAGQDEIADVALQSGNIIVAGASFQNNNMLVGMERLFYTMPTTNVEDINGGVKMTIYPNPANNILHVKVSEPASELSYTVCGVAGNVILKDSGAPAQDINVSGLAKGIYLLKVTAGDKQSIKSFVVAE